MDKAKKRIVERFRRASRVRKTVSGTQDRPRLCVRRSLKHISAQIIDDDKGLSIAQISSAHKEIVQKIASLKDKTKSDVAKIVGEYLADIAIGKGITKVVFDRKGYPFHGRIKALADGARSKGLSF
jgi:large subunit ribosomal protein L18